MAKPGAARRAQVPYKPGLTLAFAMCSLTRLRACVQAAGQSSPAAAVLQEQSAHERRRRLVAEAATMETLERGHALDSQLASGAPRQCSA